MKYKSKATIIFLALILMVSLVIATACNPARRPEPEPSPSPSPSPELAPEQNDPATEDGTAKALAQKISDLENINAATVVISGSSAWVGVDLAADLENEMTDEMKNEITTLVKREEGNIETVYVTADADMVTRLRNIANDVASGKPVSGFVQELNELGRRITPSM